MKTADDQILKESEISDIVINSLPGAFYLQDQEGRYLRWNKNFELASGYSAEEIRELNAFVFFKEADRYRMKNVINKVFEEGAAEIEIDTINKYGDTIPFYLNGRAVNYEGKRCLLGVGLDISKRTNAEKEIKKKESYLDALFNNMGGAIFLLDTHKRLVIHNNELARYFKILTGREPEIGEQAYTFLSPEELVKRNEILDRVLAGSHEITDTAYLRDGKRYFFRTSYYPILADGEVTGISCFTTDITSLKNAELARQKAQERLNYHINNSPLAAIEFDRDMMVTFWSKRATDMFGWSEQEATGKRITEFLVYEEDINKFSEAVLAGERSAETGPVATRNYAKDGRIVHTRWHNSMLTDEHGNIETVMSIIRDITDLWKAEALREEMANDLIKRNNELEQFTYIVSHNLRSPVASLIGLTSILSKYDLDDEERKEIVSGISTSAHRLDDVIRDLNEILRLKNKIDDKKETVVFSQLVAEIEQGINQYLDKEKFAIHADFSVIDEHYSQKHYLTSIFNNLITNSIKYRQEHAEPVIKIKSEVSDNKLILTFNDNGLGIDLDKIGKDLFGLYKRFHSHVDGKGLGLFMVKNQVETLGGKISVTSELNKGTEFRIEFDI